MDSTRAAIESLTQMELSSTALVQRLRAASREGSVERSLGGGGGGGGTTGAHAEGDPMMVAFSRGLGALSRVSTHDRYVALRVYPHPAACSAAGIADERVRPRRQPPFSSRVAQTAHPLCCPRPTQ
jgi:hypothetical protein